METEKSPFENVAEKATEYLKTNLELGELKAMEYGSNAFAAVMGKMILLLFGFCCLIFGSLALAVFISSATGHAWLGYLSVSGLYLLLLFVFYANREKWLHSSLANAFIAQFTKSNDKHPANLPDLQHIITESQARKVSQEAALKESVSNLADSLKPEHILLAMASKILNRYMDRKEEKEEKEEKKKSSITEPLLQFASQFTSEAVSKGIDMLRKKFFS